MVCLFSNTLIVARRKSSVFGIGVSSTQLKLVKAKSGEGSNRLAT